MSDLKYYDNAARKFYRSQNIASLPLNSWDFYAENFERVLKSSKDIITLKNLAKENRWQTPLHVENELFLNKHVIVITDTDLRIVHATHNIRAMNGYNANEVLGKTPKMFQGKDTCAETNLYIANAIKEKKPFEATILNYRKDGSSYTCWIKAQPILNSKKEVVHFIAYEKEVA